MIEDDEYRERFMDTQQSIEGLSAPLAGRIVDKHHPREYSAIMSNNGVVLCDKQEGAFLVLRYASDVERLKKLLDGLTTIGSE